MLLHLVFSAYGYFPFILLLYTAALLLPALHRHQNRVTADKLVANSHVYAYFLRATYTSCILSLIGFTLNHVFDNTEEVWCGIW